MRPPGPFAAATSAPGRAETRAPSAGGRPLSEEAGAAPGAEAVVLVHGLWMNGTECRLLHRRLGALGFDVRQFSYRTVSASLDENVRALHAFIRALDAPAVHLVGHSLGGLLVLRLHDRHTGLPPGRSVLLASPVSGSRAADALATRAWGRRILGLCLAEAVLERPPWRVGERETGIIAGRLGIGLGRLFAALEGPHDGTVAVSETRLDGAAAHRVLPVSHLSLLFSREVVAEIAHFLTFGRFS